MPNSAPEPRNETQLVNQIGIKIAQRYPTAWILKTHGNGYQRVGVPDLLVCLHGVMHGIEVKHRKPGETIEHLESRVTATQRNEIEKISAAGGVSEVVWSVEQALAVLDETDNALRELSA